MVEKSEHVKPLYKNYNEPAVRREKDKIKLLEDNVANNTILLIDGPLIAGDSYTYMIQAIKSFYNKNIIIQYENSPDIIVAITFLEK